MATRRSFRRLQPTIGARLALLLLVPLSGLLFLGSLTAIDERNAVLSAGDLREEAALVDLLASTGVQLQVLSDSIDVLKVALVEDVSLDMLGPAAGFESDDWLATKAGLGDLLDDVAAVPTDRWADPEAVDAVVATRGQLLAVDPTLAAADLDVLAAAGRNLTTALNAQTVRLEAQVATTAVRGELARIVTARESSLHVLDAASAEREAMAEYLLPIGTGGPVEDRERFLVAAAHYDVVLAELRLELPPDLLAQLDAALATEAAVAYDQLRQQALDGQVPPAEEVENLLTLIPVGLVTFQDGFDRVDEILRFDRALSAELTRGANELERGAEARLRSAVVLSSALSAAAVIASYLTVRSISVPVRQLLQRARLITTGDLTTESPQGGPSDIGLVHQALDDVLDNLRTVAEQAEALSAGRLDADVLHRQVAGPLGASVHGSVARLRSMTTRLEYEATHDSLTGLPNRAALLNVLERCLDQPTESASPLAVAMFDLDGFKQANDDLGHAVGDQVLIHVARRMAGSATADLVARLGGDEFMAVVTGEDAPSVAVGLAEEITAAIAEPIVTDEGVVHISCSAGVVDTHPGDWLSPTEVLRRADLAMYEAKSSRDAVVVFDQELHDSLLETTRLQSDIRRALEHDEFRLALQPILRVSDRQIVGYECLLRWTSPSGDEISPGLFIPVAEQSDLIEQIDVWVLHRAAAVLAGWQTDPATQDLAMSVNLSARHLSSPHLYDTVSDVIAGYALDPRLLTLEVTESQLIPNIARAEHVLRDLRQLGVRLAIDDFGTGYASVAHLRRVTFDRLKIDKTFLAHLDDETDRSLATLLVSLGRDLDLEVVAEGIETDGQLEWAAAAGCTHAQGYFIGKPAMVGDASVPTS